MAQAFALFAVPFRDRMSSTTILASALPDSLFSSFLQIIHFLLYIIT